MPPAFAANADALAVIARGADVEPLPGGYFLLILPKGQAVFAEDFFYKQRYARAVYVYAPTSRGRAGLARAVTLACNRDQEDAARRAARLCARLLRLHRERFGRDAVFPRGSGEAFVWLAPPAKTGEGRPLGGETRDNDIYLFGVPQASLEGVRTLAHEWGHLTLPAARGYTEPERDASGFLGERLYLKWLREESAAGNPPPRDDGTDRAGLDLYHARQIAPLIARFQAAGPAARDLDRTDTRGMDMYIGLALATDDALGSALLGKGLYSVMGLRARDLLTALREAAAASDLLPVRLPAWVPLTRTTYAIGLTSRSAAGAVAFADRPPLSLRRNAPAELRVLQAGWKWVRAADGDIRSITLRPARRTGTARR